MAAFTSEPKPLTNYEVKLEIEKIYKRHAEKYEAKHGKPFRNGPDDGKGYIQQVVPNVWRGDVEQASEGVSSYSIKPYEVLIFAFDPENGPMFRYSTHTSMNRPFWWLGAIVMITRHTIYWKTPRSPLQHSLPLSDIRCFAPVPPSEQGEAAENEIRDRKSVV